MFKKQSNLRVFLNYLVVHVKEFRRPGHIHGKKILLLMLRVFPIVFQNAFYGHFLKLRL